ncbi:hypothetical protein [Shimazuella kribbensis]|uniref:hypothetical protein n=1 Tax=Shimazuella kribbensis TaxID=139808 RepID=UPI0003F61C64|nr:hypothetical protein [Shimazuella kribbensis]
MSYQLNPEVKWSKVLGDHSLLDKRTGQYFTFNHTGAMIFTSLLSSKTDYEEMERTAKALQITIDKLENSFVSFRDQLIEQEIFMPISSNRGAQE